MKKKSKVLIQVLLAAALFAPGGIRPASAQAPADGAAQGADKPVPVSVVDVELMENATAYISRIQPVLKSGYQGACSSGTLSDILAAHGTSWGYLVPSASAAFTVTETQVLYERLGAYYACAAVSSASLDLCGALPAAAQGGGLTINLDMSPAYRCRERAVPVLFDAYMVGRLRGDSYCGMATSLFSPDERAGFPEREFCEAAAGGMEKIVPFAAAYAPGLSDKAVQFYPDTLKACGKDAECARNFHRYEGIKNGKPSDCAAADRPYCEAFLGRSAAPCEALLQALSASYCSYAEELGKASLP